MFFLEFPCFLHDPVNVGKFISGSSASSNPNLLYTRKGIQKKSVFIPIPKSNAKESSNYCTIALISHTSKVMLKILQARLQQYVNQELPDVQAGFRKGRGTRDQIVNIRWLLEKQDDSRKSSNSVLLTILKPLTVWITTPVENS